MCSNVIETETIKSIVPGVSVKIEYSPEEGAPSPYEAFDQVNTMFTTAKCLDFGVHCEDRWDILVQMVNRTPARKDTENWDQFIDDLSWGQNDAVARANAIIEEHYAAVADLDRGEYLARFAISKSKAVEEWGRRNFVQRLAIQARTTLRNEVQEYKDWANGDVIFCELSIVDCDPLLDPDDFTDTIGFCYGWDWAKTAARDAANTLASIYKMKLDIERKAIADDKEREQRATHAANMYGLA